jgi:hypothetical protein
MKITQMKIKNIEKWTEDYYPSVEKIKRKKPLKKNVDTLKKGNTIKQIKNKL